MGLLKSEAKEFVWECTHACQKWMHRLWKQTQCDICYRSYVYIDGASTSVKHMYMFHVKAGIDVNPNYPFCTQLEVTRKEANKESSAVKALRKEFATLVAKKDEEIQRMSDEIRGLQPIADQYGVLFAKKKELQNQFDALVTTNHGLQQMLRDLQGEKAATDSRVKELTMVVDHVMVENETLSQQNSQLKQQNEVRIHLVVAVYIESIYVCSVVQDCQLCCLVADVVL